MLESIGPGGSDNASEEVNVLPKFIAPVAKISVDKTYGRESLTVKIQNLSEGTIYRSVYDLGNGETIEVKGVEPVEHTFKPGDHQIKVTVYGPDEFSPSSSETISISVDKPYASWVKNLWWSGPLGLASLGLAGLMGLGFVRTLNEKSLSKLRGTFRFWADQNPDDETRKEFDGNNNVEAVQVAEDSQITVACNLVNGSACYSAELHREGVMIANCEFEPGIEFKLDSVRAVYIA